MDDLVISSPVVVLLLLLVHLAHGVVVDLAARPQVGLGVGEELVRAEVDDVEAAQLGVVRPVHLPLLVVGRDVAVPAHQLVEHRRHRGRRHREGRVVFRGLNSDPSLLFRPTKESIYRPN